MAAARPAPAVRALALLCLLLAGLVGLTFWSGGAAPEAVPAGRGPAAADPLDALGPELPLPPPARVLASITARPLFERDRRPLPPEEEDDWEDDWIEEEPEPAAEAPNWRLLGILRSAEGDAALFVDLDRGGRLVLQPGDEQDGWRLTELSDRSAALTHPEQGELLFRLGRRR